MLTLNRNYFLLTVSLFLIEVFIALFVRDSFVRPYVGDYLVVILIYCFFKTFLKTSVVKIASGTLLFAYAIEFLQYFHIVDRLKLAGNIVAKTVIGYGFEWWDMLAYTLGILTIMLAENFRANKKAIKQEPEISPSGR